MAVRNVRLLRQLQPAARSQAVNRLFKGQLRRVWKHRRWPFNRSGWSW